MFHKWEHDLTMGSHLQKNEYAGHCHPHQRHEGDANVLGVFRTEAQDKSVLGYNGVDVAYTLKKTNMLLN